VPTLYALVYRDKLDQDQPPQQLFVLMDDIIGEERGGGKGEGGGEVSSVKGGQHTPGGKRDLLGTGTATFLFGIYLCFSFVWSIIVPLTHIFGVSCVRACTQTYCCCIRWVQPFCV
jgi:hypothetical protein